MPSFFAFILSRSTKLRPMLSLLLFTSGVLAFGQASPTSQRTSEISAFAMYSRLTPDYGPTNNNGYTFGVDYTRLTRWLINPSIEFRYKKANGTTADERTIGGGLRGVKKIGRYSPYLDFMISHGAIDLHLDNPPVLPDGSPYNSDTSIVYGYGGGMDIHILGNFSARGDFQLEKWYIDKASNPYKPLNLSPYSWSMGVVYTVPFGRGR